MFQENFESHRCAVIGAQPRLKPVLAPAGVSRSLAICELARNSRTPFHLRHEAQWVDVRAEKIRPELAKQLLPHQLVGSRRPDTRRFPAGFFDMSSIATPAKNSSDFQPHPADALFPFEPNGIFGPGFRTGCR